MENPIKIEYLGDPYQTTNQGFERCSGAPFLRFPPERSWLNKGCGINCHEGNESEGCFRHHTRHGVDWKRFDLGCPPSQ